MVSKASQQKSAKTVLQIFFIIFIVIVADQTVLSLLLEAVAPIDLAYGWVINTFLIVSMPFAILLASWSDFHCRRKTMIFGVIALLISGTFLFLYEQFHSTWLAYAALCVKAIAANVTPVALASLATIVSRKRFTVFLAIAICAYSLGSWVPIYLRTISYLKLTTIILPLLSVWIVIGWFRESKFDNYSMKSNGFIFNNFFKFLRKEGKLIFIFIFTLYPRNFKSWSRVPR
jgi:MFS family permease